MIFNPTVQMAALKQPFITLDFVHFVRADRQRAGYLTVSSVV